MQVPEVWIIAASVLFLGGFIIGWIIGNARGRKQAKPGLNWHDFVRENAGYDFSVVRGKADHIVRLANEIGIGAQRGEEMVKTLAVRRRS
jgi:hypothetical protein